MERKITKMGQVTPVFRTASADFIRSPHVHYITRHEGLSVVTQIIRALLPINESLLIPLSVSIPHSQAPRGIDLVISSLLYFITRPRRQIFAKALANRTGELIALYSPVDRSNNETKKITTYSSDSVTGRRMSSLAADMFVPYEPTYTMEKSIARNMAAYVHLQLHGGWWGKTDRFHQFFESDERSLI